MRDDIQREIKNANHLADEIIGLGDAHPINLYDDGKYVRRMLFAMQRLTKYLESLSGQVFRLERQIEWSKTDVTKKSPHE